MHCAVLEVELSLCNNGKLDPCKYKTVNDIDKPAGVELLCKRLQKLFTHFWYGKFFLFTYKHTNKQILSSCVQLTNVEQPQGLNVHNTWLQMCFLGVLMMTTSCLGVQIPPNPKFWGLHFKPYLKKIKSLVQNHVSDWHKIWHADVAFDEGFVGGLLWWYSNSKMADGRHLEFHKVTVSQPWNG